MQGLRKSGEQVKSMVEELGLIPVSAHVPIEEMLADPDKVIVTMQRLAANT